MSDPSNTDSIRARLSSLSTEERQRLRARLTPDAGATRATTPGPPTASRQQQLFWTLHQLADHPAAFNSVLAVRLSGNLDAGLLVRAYAAVIRAYPIYRTLYRETAEGPAPVVAEDLEPQLVSTPFPGDAAAFVPEVLAYPDSDWLRPFDLSREAPIRARLYRRTPADHLFAVTFHHIVNDGRSNNLFWTALVKAYACLQRGEAVPDPPPQTQYRAYAARQHQRATGSRVESGAQPGAGSAQKGRDYWREQLRHAPPAVAFPYDYPNGAGPAEPGTEIRLPIGDLDARAATFARTRATTPNVVFLAAYFVWLYHNAAVRDAVVGVPTMGRARPADRSVLGCCIDLLSIRQRMDERISFRELVGKTHQAMTEAIRWAEVPLLHLIEARARDTPGGAGVYNTTFQYQNFVSVFEPLGDCAAEICRPRRRYAQVPLMLELFPTNEVPEARLCFDSRRFRQESVHRMLRRYLTLARAALSDPDRPIGDLDLLDAEERTLVTSTWPRGPQSNAPSVCVHHRFATVAEAAPEATALLWDEGSMTYGELDARANRVAAGLKSSGSGPGTRVGICLERSPDLIVAMLGILKAGAAYVPLDASYPRARLQFMTEDAAVSAVVTDTRGKSRVRRFGARWLLIETLLATRADAAPGQDLPAEAPAYLMYTSGSTGQPKGVLIPHRGILRLAVGADYVRIGRQDTLLQLSSPSFDAATFEIWAALLNGARLALPPPVTPSIRAIGAAIERNGVTILWLTAGLFQLVVDEAVESLRPLRALLAGGDVLSPSHVRACLDACPDLDLINGYGPTENTTFSVCHRIPRPGPEYGSIPIGRPIAGSSAYVLDRALQPLPAGVAGELCVGGAGLALGYWRRPDLTGERFVHVRLADGTATRLYRTGDLARFLPDGTLEFLGRKDRQVKIRGFRVELDEIEAALTASPVIRQAVVAVAGATDLLIAHVAPMRAEMPDAEVLRAATAAVREALPPHMHPGRWMVMAQLPLTPNGKVDRNALPVPDAAPTTATDGPTTPLESALLAIWRRVFESDAIGCSDDFFALGGNSLLAFRFVAEAERLTGYPVTLTLLFQQPTIRGLARALEAPAASTAPREEPSPDWTALVPLAGGTDGPPLVAVHGLAGDLFILRPLAEAVADLAPVYGLQGVEYGGGKRFTSIRQMAGHYAGELMAFRPQGPHVLLGYSVGGLIAFEVAAELRRRGAKVDRLFVLDTHPRNLPAHIRLPARGPFYVRRTIELVLRPGRALAILRRRIARRRARLSATGGRAGNTLDDGNIWVPPGSDHYVVLGANHVPRPCPLPTTVMTSSRPKMNLKLAWRYLAGPDVEFVPIDAPHFTFFEGAGLAQVVAALRDRLPRAAHGLDR